MKKPTQEEVKTLPIQELPPSIQEPCTYRELPSVQEPCFYPVLGRPLVLGPRDQGQDKGTEQPDHTPLAQRIKEYFHTNGPAGALELSANLDVGYDDIVRELRELRALGPTSRHESNKFTHPDKAEAYELVLRIAANLSEHDLYQHYLSTMELTDQLRLQFPNNNLTPRHVRQVVAKAIRIERGRRKEK